MKGLLKILATVLILSLTTESVANARHDNAILAALSSSKGIAAVVFAGALLNGAANFVWAFNWTRVGASNQTNAQVQEAGGLASAALSWVVAGVIPFYLYLYSEHVKRHELKNAVAGPTEME